MKLQFDVLKTLAIVILIGCSSAFGQAQAKRGIDAAVAELGEGFVSGTAKVNGTTLHYVRGGTGPAVILIHGFPQDWYEFHKIMPRLAKKFTVIAVDLRGVGGSAATPDGYDAANRTKIFISLHSNSSWSAFTLSVTTLAGWLLMRLCALVRQPRAA
jgi:hypothetical protein